MLNTQTSPIIIEHIDDKVSEPEPIYSTRANGDESTQFPMKQQTPSQIIVTRGFQTSPPYPERLSLRQTKSSS